jgi:hypothetical protein
MAQWKPLARSHRMIEGAVEADVWRCGYGWKWTVMDGGSYVDTGNALTFSLATLAAENRVSKLLCDGRAAVE